MGQPEVGEQKFSILSQQQVLGFEVAVNNPMFVQIRKDRADLLHISNHQVERKLAALWMLRAQRTPRSIFQDEERPSILYASIEYPQQVGMVKLTEYACFGEEVLTALSIRWVAAL